MHQRIRSRLGLAATAATASIVTIASPTTHADTTYSTFACPCGEAATIQGVRGIAGSSNVYICGALGDASAPSAAFLYKGPLTGGGADGVWTELVFAGTGVTDVTATSIYGPADGPGDLVRLVGIYKASATGSRNIGCLYSGPDTGVGGAWTTITPPHPNYNNCFMHSTMGQLAIGNYDIKGLATGFAFVYDIETHQSWDLSYPGAQSTTIYGIWQDDAEHYTIAGGYHTLKPTELSQAFICRWNRATHTASDFRSFSAHNQPAASVITHFEGINGNESGGYNFAADWVSVNGGLGASLVHLPRLPDGTLGEAAWGDIAYPGATITSANTVIGTTVMGIYIDEGGTGSASYVATVGADGGTCAADLNGDGEVNGADLTLLLSSWGACGGGAQ